VWVNKTDPQPFVDFNTKHVCRDFDAVRNWAEENQQPENTPKDWILPPAESDGVEVLAVAP
jgi:Mycotoxin biosynthesis protein UstYa